MESLASQNLDYRGFLLDVFNERQTKNPRYSLRAFARDIDMSHSRLSEVFSGKGGLSLEKAQSISRKLRLTPIKAANFKDMVLLCTSSHERLKRAAAKRLRAKSRATNQKDIADDQFQIVANPKYAAVYSCMMLASYDGSSDSILELMDLNSIELYEILRRLERLNLVCRDGHRWIAKPFKLTVDNGIPSEWVRSYHKEMNALGRKSIDSVPMPSRYLDSIVLPVNMEHLGEIQQKIASFCQGLIDEYCNGKDAVYGMALQFFPMTKIEKLTTHSASK
jgi:uncharacterized protein (TIGR02147 family)